MKTNKSLLAIAISASLTFPVYAETTNKDEIERITVTGEFRDLDLSKTPSSVSVLTSVEVTERAAQNLEEVVALTPNVNFSSGSSRARYYQVRGIGERSQFQQPINPSVGVVIDDVDFSGIGSVASMFDVEQVEVFRGPQGTRFGASAMAGLINIKTKAPSDSFEGKVKAMLGNYNSQALGAVISGPASDFANYRLSAEKYTSDGFIKNTHLDREDTNNRDERKVHGKLHLVLSDELIAEIGLVHIDMDNGYDAFSLDNTRETLSDKPGFDTQETNLVSSKLTYTGWEHADVIAIGSFAKSDIGYGYDEDWAFEGIHDWEYASTDHYLRERDSVTTELRLISNESSKLFDESTSWVVGLYNRSEKETLDREYTYLDENYTSDFDTNNLAIYAQLDTEINDKTTLTTGLRVEERAADFIDSGTAFFNPKEVMVGGKLVLSYQLDENTLYYASVNRGYKAGGFNTDGTLDEAFREFDSETLINYEVGTKAKLVDDKLILRASAFYSDRKDMQVKSSFTKVREDGSTEFIPAWLNAAEGFNKGLELETTYFADEGVTFYATLGLLRSEYDDYVNAEGKSLSGREQAHAPKYQFSFGGNFDISDTLYLNVSVEGKDSFYVSDTPVEDNAARTMRYEVMNVSLNYQENEWLVKLWARNIFDKDYYVRGFDSFGNDPRKFYATEPYFQYGEPGVFGATVEYSF